MAGAVGHTPRRIWGLRFSGAGPGPVTIVFAFAVIMCLGVVSWRFSTLGLEDVVGYKSPYSFAIEPGEPTSRLTRRLVFVIVDGLGFIGVDDMPVLKDIGSRGAAFSLLVHQPSFSYPGWTTLLTGAPPEISGVTTNAYDGAVPVDNLFKAAQRAGVRTALVASQDWKGLLGAAIADATYVTTPAAHDASGNAKADDDILRAALAEIERDDAGFLVVHFSSVDAAGHAAGAASSAYAAASAAVDARIGKIVANLDFTNDTMIVTSDHGHTPRGGHGGWEEDVIRVPFVAAGAGIVTPEEPGAELSWMPARHEDVAATCAALLGVPVPVHSQGRVLFEALDAPSHVVAERSIRQAEARSAFAKEYVRELGMRPQALEPISNAVLLHNDGKYEEATELASEIDSQALRAISGARRRLLGAKRLVSVPALLTLVGGLVWGLALIVGGRVANLKVPVIGSALYFAAYYGLVLAKGVAFSMSVFHAESEVTPFFMWRMVDSIVCGTLAAAVSGWWLAREERARPLDAFLAGLACVYSIVLALVLQVACFVGVEGVRFTHHLPDLHRAFKYCVDLLQTTAVGVSSPALAAVSAGVYWLRRRGGVLSAGISGRSGHSASGRARLG
ncbi:MAG: alkaline phosphatase family protein [Firmicutes bacterium]|nr:alkaline phosphatase family protein [Bacillota bacterium]